MPDLADPAPLLQTPLYGLHLELGARFVPFAGYEMPVQFAAGVLKEHLHTRSAAGLFDVSHMGQIAIRAKSGRVEDAAAALNALVPADILSLGAGRQCYTQLTNQAGGIVDDLIVAHLGDHLLLIVNAACKHADLAHLRQALPASCEIDHLEDRALIALQGPAAEAALATLNPAVARMRFMDVARLPLAGIDCVVSRSGYTGEDGYEIGMAAESAAALARALIDGETVAPIGLGARDSLRLEAGLCLYGADIDTDTSPVEAALEWSIQKSRRQGGAQAGGFQGAERILAELAQGAGRRRVGLSPEERMPVRGGARLFAIEDAVEPIGRITSGGFGPSVDRPIAMGIVAAPFTLPNTRLFAELRGSRVALRVRILPFVPHRYRIG